MLIRVQRYELGRIHTGIREDRKKFISYFFGVITYNTIVKRKNSLSPDHHNIPILFLCLLAAACGFVGYDSQDRDGDDTTEENAENSEAVIVPVDTIYASDSSWNYYVKNDSLGLDEFHQDDVPCTGNESPFYSACVHAGLKRRISIPQQSSCAGLVARDDLNALDWICNDTTGSVEIYSVGLAKGRGLGNLINGDNGTWRPNHIIVEKDGVVTALSEPGVWWTSTLIRLDTVVDPNPGTKPIELDVANAIYYLPVSFETSTGYRITNDHIGVVILPGVTLSYSDGADDISQCDGRGQLATGGLCLVYGESRSFLWLEGTFAGDTLGRVEHIVVFGGSQFLLFRNMDISGANDNGLTLRTVSHSLITDVVAHDNGDDGVQLHWNSLHTTMQRVEAHNNGGDGIIVHNSRDGVLRDLVATNNGRDGIRIEVTSGNRAYDLRAYHNVQTGVSILGTDVVHGVTSANNGGTGFRVHGNDNAVIIGALTMNNASSGFRIHNQSRGTYASAITAANNTLEGVSLNFSPGNTLSSIYSTNNIEGIRVNTQSNQSQVFESTFASNTNAELRTDSDNGFFQNVRLSGTNDCTISGTGNNVEFASSICRFTDGTPLPVVDPTNSPVGKIASDSVNATPLSGGTFDYDANTVDWIQFENPWRSIGLDGGSFPSTSSQGRCSDATTCRIWDWSLRASDSVLRDIVPVPSGNASALHYWSVADATACLQLQGLWDQPASGDCTTEFVLNTYERFDDSIGNDNGLCESGEACVILQNHGSYQGTGQLVLGPTFVDGSVTSVTLYTYTDNGVP